MTRIRETYHVPAKRGMRVEMAGLKGTILNSTGSHLRIRFDSGKRGYAHPTWEMVYFGKDGAVIKDTREVKS